MSSRRVDVVIFEDFQARGIDSGDLHDGGVRSTFRVVQLKRGVSSAGRPFRNGLGGDLQLPKGFPREEERFGEQDQSRDGNGTSRQFDRPKIHRAIGIFLHEQHSMMVVSWSSCTARP